MQKLPSHFKQFVAQYPDVADSYESLSRAILDSGPLDRKSCALVKLGMALGAKMEGAVHSHARKSLEAGATPDELRHAAVLATTTLGFPTMMAGLTWLEDVLAEKP